MGIMGNALFAATALAFVSGPAMAADMLTVGVGGYMEQWVGYVDRGDNNVDATGATVSDGGFDIQADTEIYFTGSFETDSGLTFSVDVQLEGSNRTVLDNSTGRPAGSTEIDESFVRVSGAFGTLEFGQRDPIHARMHYGINDVGIKLNAGDTQNWVPGAYLDTSGWVGGLGDSRNLIYITPRISGVQFGTSYGPDGTNENAPGGAPNGNDNSVWAAGINFDQAVGDAGVKLSLGHVTRSRDNNRSDITFTNVGAEVGFGAMQLNLAYAERDEGVPAGTWDVLGLSVTYSDGPMALSFSHMAHERDNGAERTGTMFSSSYTLAPGVVWRSSIFQAEDDTADLNGDSVRDTVDGTGFVTGLTIGF